MSNKTGVKIYKEYLDRWINAADEEKQAEINKSYIWSRATIFDYNKMHDRDGDCLFGLTFSNLAVFTRASKTQMINGHEVVAPRHDIPSKGKAFYLDFASSERFAWYASKTLSERVAYLLATNGWFDKEADVVTFANAIMGKGNELN